MRFVKMNEDNTKIWGYQRFRRIKNGKKNKGINMNPINNCSAMLAFSANVTVTFAQECHRVG